MAQPAPPGRWVDLDFAVKTYDIDFAGIVSNIVFVRWLEDLRLDMMEAAYPLRRALADGVAPVLLETHIAYRRPVTIQQRLRGRMWVKAMERVRWTVAASFVADDVVRAEAEQTGIFIRLATRKPVAVPAPLRDWVGDRAENAA
jgi:acyl-CoA thioester hydrolase